MQKNTQRLSVVSMSSSPHRALPQKGSFEVPDAELAQLRDDAVLCRRTQGLEWIRRRRGLLRSANPAHPNTPAMIGYLAQWADGEAGVAETVADLLGLFPPAERRRLTLDGYLFLRLAEGILNVVLGKPSGGDLEFVITVASSGCASPDLLLFAQLWKAELGSKTGALDAAARHAAASRDLAGQLGCPRLVARACAIEALSLLDAGLPRSAEFLRQAEVGLRDSEDWLWRSRIQDALGRAALEEGRYQSALEHFTGARDLLTGGRGGPEELGWAHLHIARARRLLASFLAGNIDARAELRRRSSQSGTAEVSSAVLRQRMERLRSDAFGALAEAEEIFRFPGNSRGMEFARLERGALWEHCGDLRKAAEHAGECFAEASRRGDLFLMAQARLLQSRIEKARYEEGLGTDLSSHAQQAHEYAREALALATDCDARPAGKRRLLAAIYVAQGLLLATEFVDGAEGARACCHSAGEHLNPAERGALWEEYQVLVSKTRHHGNSGARLKQWSEGLVEGKTFQQITEEFAEVVIPAVWAREGKSVSRVVHKLSISPKKVRRILTRAGLKS